jgi:hypothetical protein
MSESVLPIERQHVDWEQRCRPMQLAAGVRHELVMRREVIPVILVPGISGSALRHRAGDGRLLPGWPLNQSGRLLRLVLFGPRRKRRNLVGAEGYDPDMLEVIGGNDVDAPDHGLSGVGGLVYAALVQQLLFADGQRESGRAGRGLTQRFFRTPPHCFGYNWTRPVEMSAMSLRAFVTAVKDKYRRDGGRCDRVILLTHSTGGLIARWACLDAGFRDEVLGVIHGGVPHRGAPEMYYRFKSGFPRGKLIDTVIAWITARSGNEGTAILGNIPGALPLLPFESYRTSDGAKEWFVIRDSDGREVRQPRANPYDEIYRERMAWGLVDPADLDPRGPERARAAHDAYREGVRHAAEFHREIADANHPNSVNLVSAGLPTAERIEFDATDDPETIRRIRARGGRDDTHDRGEFRTIGRIEPTDPKEWALELRPRGGEGDATVPLSSASQPGVRTLRADGVSHADLLNDRRVHAIVVAEIERMLEALIADASRGAR